MLTNHDPHVHQPINPLCQGVAQRKAGTAAVITSTVQKTPDTAQLFTKPYWQLNHEHKTVFAPTKQMAKLNGSYIVFFNLFEQNPQFDSPLRESIGAVGPGLNIDSDCGVDTNLRAALIPIQQS